MSSSFAPTNTPRPELKIYKRPQRARWLELRTKCVSSTEMAPIAGMPKYGMTRFSIYHMKRGTLEDDFEGNDRTEVGQMLENGIAKITASRIGARVVRLADYYVSGTMGSSFDYEVDDLKHELHDWLVEIKNVDYMIFRDQWGEDENGNPEPPEHIAIQVQHELEVSERPGAILAVLVGGNDLKLIRIARDETFGASLRIIANKFWRDVQEGNEPEVEADDAQHVAKLFSDVDPDHHHDATTDYELTKMLGDYKTLGGQIDELKAQRNTIKARVLQDIGDASKVFGGDGYTLDAGYTKGSDPKIIDESMLGEEFGGRKGFRRFTVRRKKGAA